MFLKWDDNTQDYQDYTPGRYPNPLPDWARWEVGGMTNSTYNDLGDRLPYREKYGYGLPTTPALSRIPEPLQQWEDFKKNYYDKNPHEDQWNGNALDEYKRYLLERTMRAKGTRGEPGPFGRSNEQILRDFDASVANRRAQWEAQQQAFQTDPVTPLQKVAQTLKAQGKTIDVASLYDATPDHFYEAKASLIPRMLEQYRATGDERFNPTRQRATTFAPNTPGRPYVDPMLQQQITPEGLVQWAERRVTPGNRPSSFQPSEDIGNWDERAPGGAGKESWTGRDTVTSTGLPVNFRGGEELELIDRSKGSLAGQRYLSPAQVLQAWNQGSMKQLPQAYPGGQGIFDVNQQNLMRAHQAEFEEAMNPKDKGEKGTGSKREIELTSDMKQNLVNALSAMKGPDGKTPLYSNMQISKILSDYQKDPKAVPDSVLEKLGPQWGGIDRPLPMPSSEQTPVGAGVVTPQRQQSASQQPWYATKQLAPDWARSAFYASNPLLLLQWMVRHMPGTIAPSMSPQTKADLAQIPENLKQFPRDLAYLGNSGMDIARALLAEILRGQYSMPSPG